MALTIPTDGMTVTTDTTLAPGTYFLPSGLTIAEGVTLNGAGAVLIGSGRTGTGIRIEGRRGAAIDGVSLRDYYHGIVAVECEGLTIRGVRITSTAEVAPNTIFLDIWKQAGESYGGAIVLDRCTDCVICDNDLQHQQNGLQTFNCDRLAVRQNQCSYNSGYGIHLYGTCHSLFEENCCDYCCRFEPREGGLHVGHMGADAAGFLAVNASCHNIFRRNTARMGGDGFFLAGLAPDGRKVGCNHNLFEENDGSHSPNIAFEATFSSGNTFRGNYADRSNYGFWLGFSWDNIIENNRMLMNRQAGIAVENGHGFQVQGNTFQANGHGILLWSKYVEEFAAAYPDNLTSYDWTIEDNVFTRNGKGIRIAADQDHGIRSMPEALCGRLELRPRAHIIRANDIQDGRVGIELFNTDGTLIEGSILNRNVEANIRQDDCKDTTARNNISPAGGHL